MTQVRLDDVARRAGVSTSTASRALNGLGELSEHTRAAVARAADELGYRPSHVARWLRTQVTNTVGLVVPTISHSFYASVTHGAQATLEQHGYRLVLVDAGEEPETVEQAVQTLLSHHVDGLLVCTVPLHAARFSELAGSTPLVFIDEFAPGAGVGNVVLENAVGVSLLVEHLAGHGHRRIAFIGGPADRTSGRERRAGFLQAMNEHGLIVAEELVREARWAIASGFEHAVSLLTGGQPPSALITASAELALGALAAARRLRVEVPAELAIGCFDDLYFAPLLEPSLTSIAYDTRALGVEAASILLSTIEQGDGVRRDARIPVRLVVRRSCGCAEDPEADLAELLR